ncbi:MAG: hypothetical protein ACXVCV_19935, partial [Polyangia bacterium]
MRALFIAPLLLACSGNAGFDYIEVHGSLADGTAVNGHNLASAARVPSLLPALGQVLALGGPFQGPEDLRGFRIEWIESQISAGQTYPSDPNGPVVFYVSRATPDAGAMDLDASAVNGGAITFTSVSTKITGTLSNL